MSGDLKNGEARVNQFEMIVRQIREKKTHSFQSDHCSTSPDSSLIQVALTSSLVKLPVTASVCLLKSSSLACSLSTSSEGAVPTFSRKML